MKTETKANTASGYIRRSAIDERGEDASIRYQMRHCEELAARHGLQITEWFNEGDGSPASVFKENQRPAYDRDLAGLGHTYSTLVAYAIDRLSRRGSGAIGQLLDLAEERGGRILTNDGLDTNVEGARMMATLMGEMARAETNKQSGRIRAQKETWRLEGRPLGGTPPYGLRAVYDERGNLTAWEKDDEEAALIVEMADLYLEGATLRDICRILNDSGRTNRRGNRWQPPPLSRILKAPNLVGWRHYGGVVYTDADGEPIVVSEPVISEAKWHRLEKMATQRSRGGPRKGGGRSFVALLGGLIECGHCGSRMCHETFRSKRTTKKGERLYVSRQYACSMCTPRNGVKASVIEDAVATMALHFVERLSLDPESKIAAEVAERLMVKFTPEQANRRVAVLEEIESIKGRMQKFRRQNLAGGIEDDEFRDLDQRAGTRLADLREELETLPEAPSNLHILHDLSIGSTDPDDLVGPETVWGDMAHHRRRAILKCLIDSVQIGPRIKYRETDEETLGRLSVEFATEDNVVDMGSRRDHRPRAEKGTVQLATSA